MSWRRSLATALLFLRAFRAQSFFQAAPVLSAFLALTDGC